MRWSGLVQAIFFSIAVMLAGQSPFFAPATVQAQFPHSPWPMFQHDAQHTGRSPYVGPRTPALKWSFGPERISRSHPVIGEDGSLYLASMDGTLYALNRDGTERWRFSLSRQISTPPAVAPDGTIYIGSWDGNVYALNSEGDQLWSFTTGLLTVQSAPVIGPDGTLYVGADGGDAKLYALNPDGTEKWRFDPGGTSLTTSVAVAPDGTVYLGAHGGLYALNPDGVPKWVFAEAGNSPAIGADGTIYAGGGFDLYAINADGSQKWRFGLRSDTSGSTPTIGTDGTVYITTYDKLFAVGPDGMEKWSYGLRESVSGSVAIGGNGTIYIGSVATEGSFQDWRYVDGKLHAVNPDGTLLWTFNTGAQYPLSSPSIGSDGIVYVSSDKLYAIGEKSSVFLGLWPLLAMLVVTAGLVLIVRQISASGRRTHRHHLRQVRL